MLNRKNAFLIVSTVYSLLAFIFKLILCFLVLIQIIIPNGLLFKTLGISVIQSSFYWQQWLRTLGIDVLAGFCELVLIYINRKIVHLALAEAHWLTQRITRKLVKQHKFWCYFSIVLQTLFICSFPSALSIFYLLVVIIVTVLWVANVKVEDRSYAWCTFLIFWLTLLSILAGYILYIEWFQNLNISQNLINFLGVPLLVKSGGIGDLLQFILLLAILIISTIYQQTYQAYTRKRRIQRLKQREQQLREYGRALDKEKKGEGNSFIKVAEEVQKERMLKNQIQLAKIAGTYSKQLKQHYQERESQIEGNMTQLLNTLRQKKKDFMQHQINRAPIIKSQPKKLMTPCKYMGLVVCNYFRSFEFFMMLTRALLILWFTLYTSIPSLPLLVFFLHSVLYRNQRNFVLFLSFTYLPYMLLLILYHHVVQSVIQFGYQKIADNPEKIQYFRNLDIRSYRIYILEMGFQMMTLYIVAVSIKISYLHFGPVSPPQKSNLFIQASIFCARYFKILMVIFLFFVGISSTDLYHLLLLVFFCFYVVSSACMDRSFIAFQLLVALFPIGSYSLIVFRYFYSHQNPQIKQWISMLGLRYDFQADASYFMFIPNLMIWLLISVTFFQTKCYILLSNTKLINKLTRSFYDSHHSLIRCTYISLRFIQLHLVWISYIVIFVALILDHKSLAEYLLWAIICSLLVCQLSPNYKRTVQSRNSCGWTFLLAVTCFYLISLQAYQFIYLDYYALSLLISNLPQVILESANFLGFFEISHSQVVSFHIYKLIIIIMATLTRAARLTKYQPSSRRQSNIYHHSESGVPRINYSLFQPEFNQYPEHIFNDQDPALKDYCSIEIDTSYFILKCKKIWFILDLICGCFFEFLTFTIVILSIMFRFAFIFVILLLVISIYYGQLHRALYIRNVQFLQAHQGDLLFSNFDKRIQDRSNTIIRTDYRSRYWTCLLLLMFFLLIVIYPSQFLYQMLELKIYQNFSGAIKDTIWFSFVIGDTYQKSTAQSFLSYTWGYFLILFMLILQRKAQSWTYNRFQVDQTSKSKITRISRQEIVNKEKKKKLNKNLRKSTTYRGVMQRASSFSSDLTLIQEEPRKNTRVREKSMQIEEQARVKIEQKYKIGLARGLKATYENITMYLALVACIVKANFFSLIYIICLFLLQMCTSNNSRKMLSLTQLVACLFVLQYLVMLSNLNSLVSPFPLPPFQITSFFQWYQYIGGTKQFLRSFAQYFQLGTEQGQLKNLWFEVVLLLLLGVYFHLFCYKYFQIPQRLLFSDLRRSQVRSVQDVAQINKFLHSLGLTSLSRSITRSYLDGPKRSLGRSASLLDVDVTKIKSQMAVRDFYRVLRKIIYVFTHIFTLCLILTLAVQDSSIISCVYIIFAIYYIYKSRSFYEKYGPDRWWFPCLLKYFLYPYIQIDLLAQILFQMPMRAFFSWQKSAFNPEIFNFVGIFELWYYDSNNILQWDYSRIFTLILKGLIYAVIVMQVGIFDSDQYKIFIYKDLKKNRHENKIRGIAMSYSYNNGRLKAVCQQTASKKSLVQNLSILRQRLNELWSEKSNEFSRLATAMEVTLFRKNVKVMGASEKAEYAEGQVQLNDDQQVYQAAYREAPTSVKLYIWINNNLTNPLMVQGGRILERSKDALYLGRERVRSDIEYYMVDHYKIKKRFERDLATYEDMQDQQVDSIERLLAEEGPRANFINPALTNPKGRPYLRKQVLKKPVMPHTVYRNELRCRKMTNRYLLRIGSSIIAHTDAVAYLMMFINQMINGNLLSLILPLSILGFALMEKPRPSNLYWKFVLIYTELVIIFKFALNITTVAQLSQKEDDFLVIRLLTKNGLGSLYKDILVDTITVFILMIHQFVLISLGLWEKREHEQETISEAIDRLLHPHKMKRRKKTTFVESLDKGFDYENILEDLSPRRNRALSDDMVMYQIAPNAIIQEPQLEEEDEEQEAYQPVRRHVRFFSDGNLSILREVSRDKLDQMHQELKHIQESRLSCCKRCKKRTISLMFSCSYFSRLFPDIREQKPGVDLIALMNVPLFLAVIFVILFYSQISKNSISFAQSISQNNFSTGMVIFVLAQIGQLVLERFLYLKTRQLTLSSKGIKSDPQRQSQGVDKSHSTSTPGTTHRILRKESSMGTKSFHGIEDEKLMENPTFKHLGDQVTQIGREYAQCLRWLLHWAMILTVHFILFQYITWCNFDTFQTQKYFNKDATFWCNPFQQNWALIVLYIIYLTYLVLSALQIREGLPELRSINAITRQDTLLNKWIYQGYLAIPFLWELRTITDWTFTKTALDLFQWFKFEDIYSTLYITKVTTKSYRAHPLGQKRQFIYKILQGACTLLGLLLLIFLPMVFFSGLNPISEVNNVTGAQVQFNLKLNDTTTYNLFQIGNTASLDSITSYKDTNSSIYKKLFDNNRIYFIDYQPEQIQIPQLNKVASSNWEITPLAVEEVNQFLANYNQTSGSEPQLEIQMQADFTRPLPAGGQSITSKSSLLVDRTDYVLINQLQRVFSRNECTNRTFDLDNFYVPYLHLTSNQDPKFFHDSKVSSKETISLLFHCQITSFNSSGHTVYETQRYWSAYTRLNSTVLESSNGTLIGGQNQLSSIQNSPGIVFLTVSDKVASSFINFSVLTFYISVVLVVGQFLRNFCKGGAQTVVLKEMPFPDDLLLLCEAIVVSRIQNNLQRQQELYFVLIELLRSPETVRAITKSSLRKQN